MKKQHLIPALAIAVVATGLSLPATASADNIKSTVKPSDTHRHEVSVRTGQERRVSDVRSYDHARSAAPRYQHDHGRHVGHQHRHVYRHEHGTVVRYEPRYEPRPVVRYEPRYESRPVVRYEPRYEYHPQVRYEPRHDDDIRVRISYDLHL